MSSIARKIQKNLQRNGRPVVRVPGVSGKSGRVIMDDGLGPERLVWAGIIREGTLYGHRYRSHAEVRSSIGDRNPTNRVPGDQEGFITDSGRFVNRYEAVDIGIVAGQLDPSWWNVARELLSSDIKW